LRELRNHSLPEPEDRGRLPAEWDGQFCVQARDRAAPWPWTLPAGFSKNGETLPPPAGAIRETLEEANAPRRAWDLYTVISLPQINQVYMMFRAQLEDVDFRPGPKSLDVRLFDERDIPWEALAFRHDRAYASQLVPRSQERGVSTASVGTVAAAAGAARSSGRGVAPIPRLLFPCTNAHRDHGGRWRPVSAARVSQCPRQHTS